MKKSNTLFLSTTTKRIIPLVFFVFLLLSSSFVLGAARTASVSGLWSSTATWGGAAIPTSADAVTINSGITVTVDMAAQCASLTFAAVAASSTVTISGTNSLAIIGLLSMPRPSSGFLCTVNVNAGTLTCGTLTMSATTSGRNDVFNITSGSATISGNATTGTTGCIFNFTGAGSLFFGGTISSTPTLTTFSGSTVSYTSASSQTVLAGSYSNLTLSGAGAKTLNGASSVSGNLTLTSGILTTTTTNLLSITNTTSTAIFGGSTTSYISGPLKWTLPASLASGSNYNFPVGKGGVYLPFSLNSPTTGTGTVTAQVEAFNVSAAGTYDASLTSTSTTEYWSLLTSGNFTNSSVSLVRQTAISPLDAIGGSTSKTGIYTYLAGSPNTNSVTNSNVIGVNRFFLLGKAGCIAPPANPAYPISDGPQCTTPGVTLTMNGTPPANETWYWQTSATGTSTANSSNTYNVTTSATYYIRSQNNTSLCWSTGAGSIAVVVLGLPTITTPTSAAITFNTANLGGNITTIGCPDVTMRGIYYSTTNGFPDGSGTQVMENSGPYSTGTFSVPVSGLTPSTTYYYKAFATNSMGSAYSTQGTFATTCAPVSLYPWTENFDAMSPIGASILPNCWKPEGSYWRSSDGTYTTYHDPLSPPNYITVLGYTASMYLITPGFSLTAGNAYNFSFQYVGDGQPGWAVDIRYNTTQTGVGSTLLGNVLYTSGTPPTSYTLANRTFYPTTSGMYYFMVHTNNLTYSPPYYMGFDNFSMTETPLQPPVITSFGSSEACASSSLLIKGTYLSGAYAVSVGGTPATITSNTDTTLTVTLGIGTTGTVSVTTPGGTVVSADIFTVKPVPTASASGISPICVGSALQLTGTTDIGDTYSWTGPNGFASSSQNPTIPSVTTAATGTYSFTASFNGCASLVSTTSVVVPPNNPVITPNPATICTSGTSVISTNPATGYGTATFQWQNSTDSITFTDIPGANAISYTTPTISSTTYYKLQIKVAGNLCSESNVTTVKVENPIIISTTPASRCGAGTLNLGATTTPGSILNWYAAATGGTSIGTGSPFTTPTISNNTTYYVGAQSANSATFNGGKLTYTTISLMTSANYGLNFDVTTAFTLNSVDVYNGNSSSSTMIIRLLNSAGTTIYTSGTFTVPGGTGNTAYTASLGWAIPVGTQYRIIVVQTGSTVNLIRESVSGFPYAIGTAGSITSGWLGGNQAWYVYFYNWNVTTGCQSGRTPVVATVVTAPSITASATVPAVCDGDPTTLNATSSNTGYSYSWSPSTSPINGASVTAAPSISTLYSVSAIDTSGGTYNGCTKTATVNVSVNPIPSAFSVNASSTAICTGDSVNLSASANSNANSLVNFSEGFETWYPAGWTFINAGSGNLWESSSTYAHGGTKSMFYTFNSTYAANAWGITPSFTLTAGTTYTISFWYRVEDGTYPEKMKVTVGTSPTVAAQTTSLWSNAALTNTTWAQGTANYTPATTGTYYFAFNCYSALDMYDLYVDDVSITGGTIISPTYSWISSPVGFTSNLQNPTGITPSTTTQYTVIAQNSYGCSASANITVSVGSSVAPTGNTPQVFLNASTIADLVVNGTNIKWYDATTGGNLLLSTDVLIDGHNYYASQTINGCESQTRLEVNVIVFLIKTVNLHLFLEGLFNPATNTMNAAMDGNTSLPQYSPSIVDRIQVDLFAENSPYAPIGVSISGIDLAPDGLASFQISPTWSGNYYIRVKSRNHLETWSAIPVPFNTTNVNYNFTTAMLQAFGSSPQVLVSTNPPLFAFYLGDLDQGGWVDAIDFNLFEPELTAGSVGFILSDFDGGGWVDAIDFNMFEPRLTSGNSSEYPAKK